MALYIVQVPDPPVGVDWLAAVPGEYLYNVTGITGILSTGIAASLVATDVSGNGNDGTYQVPGPLPVFVPGLLPTGTNDATNFDALFPPVGINPAVVMPPGLLDMSQPFTIEMWVQATPLAQAHGFGSLLGAAPPGGAPDLRYFMDATFTISLEQNGASINSVDGTALMDGLPHYLVCSYDTFGVGFWFDAVLQTNLTDAAPYFATDFTEMELAASVTVAYSYGIFDEFALYPSAFDGSIVSVHSGAAFTSFAAYVAAVLADHPTVYYHLGPSPSTGRQVALNITNGTERVALIPTGFVEVTTPGPYAYSWVPRLGNAAETPDGKTITVPTPPLILPAGYSIGANTLDLAPDDQWSNVTIWWDSNIMDAQSAQSAYLFPPSVHLVYHQEP